MRSAIRFPLRLPVSVKGGTDAKDAQTTDISAGGVLLEVDSEMPIGSTIEFAICMPASVLGTPTDVLVNCVGRVVRSFQEGEQRGVAAVIDEYRLERA